MQGSTSPCRVPSLLVCSFDLSWSFISVAKWLHPSLPRLRRRLDPGECNSVHQCTGDTCIKFEESEELRNLNSPVMLPAGMDQCAAGHEVVW